MQKKRHRALLDIVSGALPFLLLFMLSACGYRSLNSGFDDTPSISVPYIQGDPDATLNNELVSQLSQSGQFHCVQSGGDLLLQVVLVGDTNERIGYRYDRDNTTNKLEKNLLGVENRRCVTAEVTVFNAHTEEVLLGPCLIKTSNDYDYVDSGSPRELTFTNSKGVSQPVIQFSLGQLDSVEGAHDDASVPLFRLLSQRIVMGLLNQLHAQEAR